jgi:cytochrome c556
MKMSRANKFLALAIAALGAGAALAANVQMKSEDAIAFRQSGYKFMAWNMGRIKMNLDGQFNKDEVVQAANVIQAVANSGMGKLYVPGSDKGRGWKDTQVKPELFADKDGVGKVAKAFNEAANEMAKVAASGDQAAVKAQFGKLGESCKACHEKYRVEEK